ncbi:methylation-associated defense system restriction endonuclease subunit S MAD5 [Billgrantia bachuensis]|uniref:Restriction endonuclease subunit S n=1 Tax=Billgrantia bachuensis TaxID=2717286 RepID=A0ABX0PTC4_9GAMM|nr:restriction endonuclease subunit S [Halomonas bachuensis]NIC05352.1 restriction endonuclease subunit S [Halomonas bachuensis]
MSRQFQIKAVPSSWIEKQGHRLDCGPYMSGAMEAREILSQLPARKDHLQNLTKGGMSGIINAGRITRLWVDDYQHGYPFLSSTDILQADLSTISHIAKSVARQNSQLLIKDRWTLITRSGSIGRMAYSRADMNGMACTEDVLRVIPDESKVKPGYIYAYLGTKFGLPIVTSGTYGSIITHLEPHHIADLPVPRLGAVEDEAHELIQQAADLRTEASQLIAEQVKTLEEEIAGGTIAWEHNKPQAFSIEARTVSGFANRLDAFHHIGFVGEAEKKANVPLIDIADVAAALRPPIFKRVHVQEGGYEFLGGADVMTMGQKSEDRISAKTKHIDKFIVKQGQVLFQCVGQRYGIFGRPTLANRNLIGKAVSEHQIRITPHDLKDAGYVFTYLATGFGLRFLLKNSSGTSIPVLQEDGARRIQIYWPDAKKRHQISAIAEKAWENRARAVELEEEARSLVERAIEEGGR